MRQYRILAFFAVFSIIVLLTSCGDDNPPNGPTQKTSIVAVNGLYYKGTMGDSTFNQPLEFTVTDDKGNHLPNQQILLSLVEGDGTLGSSSITTDSTGMATFSYTFSGSLGHAIVRLTVPDVDTVDVFLRADVLIPGEHGQGQYVLFDDDYSKVLTFNNTPVRIDTIVGDHPIIYVNYESSLGVVVMLYDQDLDKTVYDTSSVYGVIVNTKYNGHTLDSVPVGIGTPLQTIRANFGTPDTLYYDPPRPEIIIRYDSLQTTFYGHWEAGYGDTFIEEIHIYEQFQFLTNKSHEEVLPGLRLSHFKKQ